MSLLVDEEGHFFIIFSCFILILHKTVKPFYDAAGCGFSGTVAKNVVNTFLAHS